MPSKKPKTDPVAEEKLAEAEAEGMAHHASDPSIDASEENLDEEAEKALTVEEGADVDQVVPAEVAAIHTDNATAQELNDAAEAPKKPAKKPAAKKVKTANAKSGHSKAYHAAKAQIEKGKAYKLIEAIELAQKTSVSKFDGAIELHLRLNKKKGKSNTESTRGTVHLPHGNGREPKIAVLTEAMIEEIAKTKKAPFDIYIAAPALMPKVGKIAKILGPQGKMPDPKSGTVTDKPDSVLEEIKSGKVEYRIDASGNVHLTLGRVSWEAEKMLANAQAVINSFSRPRLAAVYICASIGPSAAVDLTSL